MPQPFLDTHLCPVCGQSNQCALMAGQAAETCWCMAAEISPAALAALADALRGCACLCPTCAVQAPQHTGQKPPAAPI